MLYSEMAQMSVAEIVSLLKKEKIALVTLRLSGDVKLVDIRSAKLKIARLMTLLSKKIKK